MKIKLTLNSAVKKRLPILFIIGVVIFVEYILKLSHNIKIATIYYELFLIVLIFSQLIKMGSFIKIIKHIFYYCTMLIPYLMISKPNKSNNLLGVFCGLLVGIVCMIANFEQFKSVILRKSLKSKVPITLKEKIINIIECLIIPTFEELFFRGVILYLLFEELGYLSVIISSILFVLAHYMSKFSALLQSRRAYLYQFALSIMIGCVYVYTNSILGCIVAHFILNMWKLIELIIKPIETNEMEFFNDY